MLPLSFVLIETFLVFEFSVIFRIDFYLFICVLLWVFPRLILFFFFNVSLQFWHISISTNLTLFIIYLLLFLVIFLIFFSHKKCVDNSWFFLWDKLRFVCILNFFLSQLDFEIVCLNDLLHVNLAFFFSFFVLFSIAWCCEQADIFPIRWIIININDLLFQFVHLLFVGIRTQGLHLFEASHDFPLFNKLDLLIALWKGFGLSLRFDNFLQFFELGNLFVLDFLGKTRSLKESFDISQLFLVGLFPDLRTCFSLFDTWHDSVELIELQLVFLVVLVSWISLQLCGFLIRAVIFLMFLPFIIFILFRHFISILFF